jgi:hypothetical protein
MTTRDPAAARFAVINLARICGVACVIAGMLVSSNRLFAAAPDWAGYPFIAAGLVGAFVAPVLLARKWRTPE